MALGGWPGVCISHIIIVEAEVVDDPATQDGCFLALYTPSTRPDLLHSHDYLMLLIIGLKQ